MFGTIVDIFAPEHFAFMAWTWQTGLFFGGIATGLVVLTLLAVYTPEVPQVGILGIPTTRGDRFFLSLLGSAFIHLGWIGLAGGESMVWASAISLLYAAVLFRFA